VHGQGFRPGDSIKRVIVCNDQDQTMDRQ
jgi:hypothetical protein